MNTFIIVSGPTGVGKTEYVDQLITQLPIPIEIINADMGQMYKPLTIGTAKPDYLKSSVKQHLFEILDKPLDFTVAEFRHRALALMQDMWARSVIPLVVGGSSFYLASLFFPPQAQMGTLPEKYASMQSSDLWQELVAIDPARAAQIHPQDRYRLERALTVWFTTHTLPSSAMPLFDPPGNCAFFYLTRDRDELNERIDQRVIAMFQAGWIEEVRGLDSTWREFLLKKKLIGYPSIIQFLEQGKEFPQKPSQAISEAQLIQDISTKTRAYARRQLIFWRMLKKKLDAADPLRERIQILEEIDLSNPQSLDKLVLSLNRFLGLALNAKEL